MTHNFRFLCEISVKTCSLQANCGTHSIVQTSSFQHWKLHWRIWAHHILICIWFTGRSPTKKMVNCSQPAQTERPCFHRLISWTHGVNWRRLLMPVSPRASVSPTSTKHKLNACWIRAASSQWPTKSNAILICLNRNWANTCIQLALFSPHTVHWVRHNVRGSPKMIPSCSKTQK